MGGREEAGGRPAHLPAARSPPAVDQRERESKTGLADGCSRSAAGQPPPYLTGRGVSQRQGGRARGRGGRPGRGTQSALPARVPDCPSVTVFFMGHILLFFPFLQGCPSWLQKSINSFFYLSNFLLRCNCQKIGTNDRRNTLTCLTQFTYCSHFGKSSYFKFQRKIVTPLTPNNQVPPKNNVSIPTDMVFCSLTAPSHRWVRLRGRFKNEKLPEPFTPLPLLTALVGDRKPVLFLVSLREPGEEEKESSLVRGGACQTRDSLPNCSLSKARAALGLSHLPEPPGSVYPLSQVGRVIFTHHASWNARSLN